MVGCNSCLLHQRARSGQPPSFASSELKASHLGPIAIELNIFDVPNGPQRCLQEWRGCKGSTRVVEVEVDNRIQLVCADEFAEVKHVTRTDVECERTEAVL